MTKEEILDKLIWSEYDAATINVYHKELDKNVELYIFPLDNEPRVINNNIIDAINDFINLDKEDIEYIKEYLFWFCNICCDSTSYGDLDIDFQNGETETEANLRFFGVNNKEDTFNRSKLREVTIEGNDGREVIMYFSVRWEEEHGCDIRIVNGEIERFEE